MYRSWILVLLTTLVGCQTSYYIGNENSPFYVVPAGTRVSLNRELPIAPDRLAVFVQNGQVVTTSEMRHYEPFCRFELWTLSSAARTILPDEMIVVSAGQHVFDGAMYAEAARIHLASLSVTVADQGSAGGPPLQSYLTRMKLRSEKQPDISALTCSMWGYLPEVRHVTIAEIRQTLGGVATLRLPNQ